MIEAVLDAFGVGVGNFWTFVVLFILGFIASYALILLATGISIVRLFLTPGRKGYITESFEGVRRGTDAAGARDEFLHRLSSLGFEIDSEDTAEIRATRPRRTIKLGSYEDFEFESYKMNAVLRIVEKTQLKKTDVDLELKSGEWILSDRYPRTYMRKLGEFLLADEFDPSDPPVVSKHSSGSEVIFISALLGLGLVGFLFTPYWPEKYNLHGLVLHTIGCLGFSVSYICSGSRRIAGMRPTTIRPSILISGATVLTIVTSLILHLRWEKTYLWTTLIYALASGFAWPLIKRLEILDQRLAEEDKVA